MNPITITANTLISNSATDGGAIYIYDTTAVIHFNRIIGNKNYDIYNKGGSVDAQYNWWGNNLVGINPITAGRLNSGTATFWMVLSISALPTTIPLNGTSIITTDLLHDNKGVYHNPTAGVIPYTGSTNFKVNKGIINNTNFSNGIATSTFNAQTATGVANVSANVDSTTVNTNITINTVANPLTIISIDPANYAVNVATNKVITVNFSEPITAGTGYSSISVLNSNGSVPQIFTSVSGNTLTITRSGSYVNGDTYIITIPANALKDAGGNNLASTYTSSFTIIT